MFVKSTIGVWKGLKVIGCQGLINWSQIRLVDVAYAAVDVEVLFFLEISDFLSYRAGL